jgi:CBS domain containing-hemolysin-like protein
VDTVGGLVMALLDRPAEVGDHVTYGGVKFEVIAVDGYSVIRCKASLNEEDSSGKATAG